MATQLIGDSTWEEVPGGSEQNGEDGSITVVRVYNGAITGGAGGSGATSWEDFRATYEPGTSDRVYGSDVRSVSYPSLTRVGRSTYEASITYRGGDFSGDGEGQEVGATIPTVTVSTVSLSLQVTDDSGFKHAITYKAQQTIVVYVRQNQPSSSGHYSARADTTDVSLAPVDIVDEILGDPAPELGALYLTEAELDDLVTQDDVKLVDLTHTLRGAETGSPVYDVTEVWLKNITAVRA